MHNFAKRVFLLGLWSGEEGEIQRIPGVSGLRWCRGMRCDETWAINHEGLAISKTESRRGCLIQTLLSCFRKQLSATTSKDEYFRLSVLFCTKTFWKSLVVKNNFLVSLNILFFSKKKLWKNKTIFLFHQTCSWKSAIHLPFRNTKVTFLDSSRKEKLWKRKKYEKNKDNFPLQYCWVSKILNSISKKSFYSFPFFFPGYGTESGQARCAIFTYYLSENSETPTSGVFTFKLARGVSCYF